jgi:hypothetical protein
MTDVEGQILLQTICLPAAVTVGGLTVATIVAQRWPRARAPLVTFALALGFAAAEIAIRGWQDPWPADAIRRLPHAALLVAAICAIRAALPCRWTGLFLSMMVAGIVSGTFVNTGVIAENAASEKAVWWIGFGSLFLASQFSLEQLAARRATPPLCTLWAGCVGVSASLLAASGSLSLGQVCGALAVCLAVAVVFAWRSPSLSMHAGPAELLAVVVGVLLAAGSLFSELPRSAAILTAVSPHAAWIGSVPWLRARPWRGWIVQALVATALLGAAAGIVIATRPAETSNPYAY